MKIKKIIKKEILGPSWARKKNNEFKKSSYRPKDLLQIKQITINRNIQLSHENYEKEKEQSVKAIALIRAYRIRGHLIANLIHLEMMERKYLK